MIDTEGYELRKIRWWYSPLTGKQVHMDTYSMLSYWHWMVEADVIRFLRERGFIGEEYLLLEGEFDRGELQEREGMFRIDQTKPVIIRRYVEYVPEFYTPRLLEEELLTTYTIIEKLEYMMIELTFSIETDVGHEIFFAEVHADTTIQVVADEEEIARRVVNAVLKLFFIIFDGWKVVYTAEKERDPQWLINLLVYLQSPDFDPAFERGPKEGMDGFLSIVMERILSKIAIEGLDYFLTRESFLAIGIEYGTPDLVVEYPSVRVIVEKTRKGRWKFERTLIVAPTTDVWLDDILDMGITYIREER